MNRRDFLRTTALAPCALVGAAGVVAVAPAIHTTGYLRTVDTAKHIAPSWYEYSIVSTDGEFIYSTTREHNDGTVTLRMGA